MAQGASPQKLVILLYEQLIQDLHRAVAAIERSDVEQRTQELSHALLILGELQGRLDMERGGEVSSNLDRFYSVLRACLLDAQFSGSKHVLRDQIERLIEVREAWVEVERSSPRTAPLGGPTGITGANENDGSHTPADWKA
jgi:flagellar protein FliS